MENNSKLNRMTAEMKAFEHMKNAERHEKQALDTVLSENEAFSPDLTPAEILMKVSGMLLECSLMTAKAAFLTSLMEDDEEDDEDDEDEDSCDICPYAGSCGKTMVLVCRPGGDNTIMTIEELAEEIGELSLYETGTYDLHPVPGTEDLYYTIPEKKPVKRGGKNYFRGPAIVFGINEDEGKLTSPNAIQLYQAAQFFEKVTVTIRTSEGEVSAFRFD